MPSSAYGPWATIGCSTWTAWKIFGPEHIDHLPDRLHPDAEGYRIMADNFEKYVMEEMGIAKMLAEKTSGRA